MVFQLSDDQIMDIQIASAALPKGPWEVWTSNSFRRVSGPDGCDGGVLCGTVQRSDGHPDLSMTEDELFALCQIVNIVRCAVAPDDLVNPTKEG